MNKKERCYITDRIYEEGMEYVFVNYSRFSEIEDEKFHELREAYIKAVTDLSTYLKLEI